MGSDAGLPRSRGRAAGGGGLPTLDLGQPCEAVTRSAAGASRRNRRQGPIPAPIGLDAERDRERILDPVDRVDRQLVAQTFGQVFEIHFVVARQDDRAQPAAIGGEHLFLDAADRQACCRSG